MSFQDQVSGTCADTRFTESSVGKDDTGETSNHHYTVTYEDRPKPNISIFSSVNAIGHKSCKGKGAQQTTNTIYSHVFVLLAEGLQDHDEEIEHQTQVQEQCEPQTSNLLVLLRDHQNKQRTILVKVAGAFPKHCVADQLWEVKVARVVDEELVTVVDAVCQRYVHEQLHRVGLQVFISPDHRGEPKVTQRNNQKIRCKIF